MNTDKSLKSVTQLIDRKSSFVLNIVASWCPDCTEAQAPHLNSFERKLEKLGLPFVSLKVQEQKHVYLSDEMEQLTLSLGGHGFPRTVLFIDGIPVDADNVEVTSADGLSALADKFADYTR